MLVDGNELRSIERLVFSRFSTVKRSLFEARVTDCWVREDTEKVGHEDPSDVEVV